MAWLTRAWNRVKPPQTLATRSIIRVQETTYAVLTSGNADDHLVLHGQGRRGDAVSFCVIGDHDIADHVAGLAIECYHVRVDGSHEEPVAQHRQPAVHLAAANVDPFRKTAPVIPVGASVPGI